ncbi:MAG: carbohydrate ABC transporter permease [Candidatus Gastranaerophilales bacterium]|nr:carbohydrate ABC transporter permease [Candidatus Gastranaerophilales bacterium]
MKPKNILMHFFLIIVSIISLLPFVWLLSTALKSGGENIFAYPPELIPRHITFDSFTGVWAQIPFMAYIWNSLIVAGVTVVLNLLFSSLAAYPLARMQFGGKNFVFFAILSTIMVPFQVIMIPVYLIVLKLGLVDTVSDFNGFLGLILPFAVNAFGIFLMRQSYMGIPKEMDEAAICDGCNSFELWYKVLLPMSKPALATLAIFTFVGCWGEFLWPSIVLSKQTMFTLPVGINHLQGVFSSNWRYIAAGSVISTVPILIFFLSLQKYFISGQNQGALKN